ncbi:Uma2 family endonuclease [Hassallia byssoidea VB512170]|uniref:Uma2 family endonuclease n=1 Tax=Hassallia byssoidea VB512170 TaxID=1304833 RepID=A0A846HDN2_9CYAN|nr:Uma2 family endonuclease [Hassalia byssoidea]NEU75163.1 Uma2 family endonuclease [Hassalia byssoidea VB512170]
MVQQLTPDTAALVIYPESDGQPMADNTEQFQWIVKIKENLEILFALQDNVFVAGNLLWYAVQGDVKVRQAPDAMVVFGRPKGKRGSYKQWEEDNIPPQVVFEILSPGNKTKDMANKLLFYQRHGVEEYYIYDPQTNELTGLLREQDNLEVIEEINNWVSPRLEIRFELTPNTLEIFSPSGRRFLTSVELDQIREHERQRAEHERQRAEHEHQRAEQERQEKEAAQLQLEEERQRYQDLLARLQERGIDL